MIFATCYFPGPEDRGQFGDMFGAVNALFSGLAFAGVIWAIILQKQELELQRKELEATRAELEGQRKQLEAQDRTLQKQNFESSFFQLLSFHNEIVNSLKTQSWKGDDVEGRICFYFFLEELRLIYNPYPKTSSQIDDIKGIYEQFLGRYQSSIGHYFRYLYNTIKFVDRHEFIKKFKDKKAYTNLIRAQLSSNELGLLFYNCLSDQGAKFKDLVEKYALLEGMDFRKLFDEKHRSLYAESAYGESDQEENQ